MHDSRTRVAIVADYLEELWPSMDLVADMLMRELSARRDESMAVDLLRPQFTLRFSRGYGACSPRVAVNADRLINRFVDYPRFLKSRKSDFDLFHIVDHTYAHLVRVAGADRCVVTCHDLDALRPVTEPNGNGNSWLLARMARRILAGFAGAAAIACDSAATLDAVLRFHLAPAQRLSVNPNGVADIFSPCPDPDADAQVCSLLGSADPHAPEILHVGSTIPRKRIDLLLRIFVALRRELPTARLIRVGGTFTAAQRRLMDQLALPGDSVRILPFLDRETLAAVYRRAALVLLPSEAEGYGLPALEAMACGTPVLASDIAALREVGGPATAFCPVADVPRWSAALLALLDERRESSSGWAERCDAGVKWAARFTWREYADRAADLYRAIAAG